jgi:hypothetical protein
MPLGRTYVMMKLKFDIISSRAYSGKNLNASGASEGSGSLDYNESLIQIRWKFHAYLIVLSGV